MVPGSGHRVVLPDHRRVVGGRAARAGDIDRGVSYASAPGWLTWASVGIAPLVFFSPASLPALLFPAWVLTVSAVLLAHRSV